MERLAPVVDVTGAVFECMDLPFFEICRKQDELQEASARYMKLNAQNRVWNDKWAPLGTSKSAIQKRREGRMNEAIQLKQINTMEPSNVF